jgi:hypothetical protein
MPHRHHHHHHPSSSSSSRGGNNGLGSVFTFPNIEKLSQVGDRIEAYIPGLRTSAGKLHSASPGVTTLFCVILCVREKESYRRFV